MQLCGFDIGLEHRIFLIAGPCVIESEQLQMDTAGTLKEITTALGIAIAVVVIALNTVLLVLTFSGA